MTAPTVVRTNPNGVESRIQVSLSGTYTAASDVVALSDGVSLAAGVLVIAAGFEPTYVKVINVTDRLEQEWWKGMNQGDFLETVAAGDKTLETDDKLVVAVAETGSAPVTIKPAYSVTVLADGGAITDNDTVVVIIQG
jgi:hypothetical protein